LAKSEAPSATKERTECQDGCTMTSLGENGWDFAPHVVKSYLLPLGQNLLQIGYIIQEMNAEADINVK
jgi:hypothetical protein